MFSVGTFCAICAIVVFLTGVAFGGLVLFVISIHRTSRRPLTEIYGQRRGVVSRSVLTSTRINRKGGGE